MNTPLTPFSVAGSDGKTYTHETLQTGTWVVYAYPKDNTPGCTIEANDFATLHNQFVAAGATVLGISKDGLASHDRFCKKYNLPFVLLADEEKTLLQALGAWVEKSMFGKKYMGIERSTFLIRDGVITQEWRKVKVKRHAQAVLDALLA